MAINCYLTLNGTAFHPLLPIGRKPLLVRSQRRMLNGQLRTVHRAKKYEFTFSLTDATEAQYSAWIAAADVTQSVPFVDERGVSRTVVIQSVTEDLTRTEPTVPDGSATTGPGFYDLTIVAEEV